MGADQRDAKTSGQRRSTAKCVRCAPSSPSANCQRVLYSSFPQESREHRVFAVGSKQSRPTSVDGKSEREEGGHQCAATAPHLGRRTSRRSRSRSSRRKAPAQECCQPSVA
eukprot:3504001-Pleurochrysis_carterae.AAC.1